MNRTIEVKPLTCPTCLQGVDWGNCIYYWKGYVVKHNYVNYDVLMTILDNYMFRPLLAIFRLSSRELKVLLDTMCARDGGISNPGFVA